MRQRHRDLACQQLVELVSAFLDGDLAPRDRHAVERHLAACDDCAGYVEQVRRLLDLTAHTPRPGLAPERVDELVSRFRSAHE